MPNYTKIAVTGAATVFVVSIMAAFLGYLVRFILARGLSVEEFGLFYAVFSFLALLSLLKTLGYDRALIKFIPEFLAKKQYDLIKSSIIYISIIQLVTNLIVIVVVYFAANFLSINFFKAEEASLILKLLAIGFFIDSFVVIVRFCFQGFKNMLLFSILDLIRMLSIVIIILTAFNMGFGLLSPVLAYMIAPLFLLIIFGFIFIKFVFPKFIDTPIIYDNKLFKKISKYSIFILLTSSGVLILGHTDSLMLTYFTGISAVGLYNVALPTSKILTYFPLAIGSVLLPITAELWAKKKMVLLKDGMEMLYKYSILVILPLALIMLSFTDLILLVLFGKDYVPAGLALKILSIGTIFITLHQINANFFSGIGKPQIHSKIIFSAVGLNFLGNLILIPILGIVGAALTTTASYLLMTGIGLIKIKRFVKIKLPILVWSKTLVSGTIFVVAIWFLKGVFIMNIWAETILVLILSGILYLTALIVSGVIHISEIRQLYKRVLK
jgi:O-antigen/teichoic acid export membrane protein